MTRAALAGTTVLLVAASVAFAAPPPGSSLEDRRIYYADQAIQDAGKKVEREHACRLRPPPRGPVDGTPSATLLNSIAALRRPANPGEDLSLVPPQAPRFGELSIYRDYIRLIPLPGTTGFKVFPLHDVSRASPRPKRCATELRERVKRAIADRPRAFKRIARRLLRQEIAEYWLPRQREGLIVANPNGGVGVDLSTFLRRGAFMFGYGTAGGQLFGLVPDGVATVDFTFRRFEPKGYWSKHHPVTHRTTGIVTNNAVAVTGPNSLRDGAYYDQVWRASDGSVIRVIRG